MNFSRLLLFCELKGRKASFLHLVLGHAFALVLLYPPNSLSFQFFNDRR